MVIPLHSFVRDSHEVALVFRVHISTFHYSSQSQRRWNLILDDGVVVQLPEEDWRKQLDVLERLIIDKGVLERDIVQIDLRSPTHYFFLLKSGEKKDAVRGKET